MKKIFLDSGLRITTAEDFKCKVFGADQCGALKTNLSLNCTNLTFLWENIFCDEEKSSANWHDKIRTSVRSERNSGQEGVNRNNCFIRSRHSSVDSSVSSILKSRVQITSIPSILFSIYSLLYCICHCIEKRKKVNKKRPGLAYFSTNRRKTYHGGSPVVSLLAVYSDDLSSNLTDAYSFFDQNVVWNEQKEAEVGPFLHLRLMVTSIHIGVLYTKFWWLDSNPDSLALEATNMPNVPQSLPYHHQ